MGRKPTKQTITIAEFEFLYEFAHKEFKSKGRLLDNLRYELHLKIKQQKQDKKQLQEYFTLLKNNKTLTGPLKYKIKCEIDELLRNRFYRKSEIRDLEITIKKTKVEFVELHNTLYKLRGEPIK